MLDKSIKSTGKNLWSSENLLAEFMPLHDSIHRHPRAIGFREEVDAEGLEIPEYYEVIKHPMALCNIADKLHEGSYRDPWAVVNDFWRMFNNCLVFNRKSTQIYKDCNQLIEVFLERANPLMRRLGFCCANFLFYEPKLIMCNTAKNCLIRTNNVYYKANSPQSEFFVCEMCYLSSGEYVEMSENNRILRALFVEMKNDVREQESLVECCECGRAWHTVCGLYRDIGSQFYCAVCKPDGEIVRPYTPEMIPASELSAFIEERANSTLTGYDPTVEPVTIRDFVNTDNPMEYLARMRVRYFCKRCLDYDLCADCYASNTHPHELHEDRDGLGLVELFSHVFECPTRDCAVQFCSRIKQIRLHFDNCGVAGCGLCRDFCAGLVNHSRQCQLETCHVYHCRNREPGLADSRSTRALQLTSSAQSTPKPKIAMSDETRRFYVQTLFAKIKEIKTLYTDPRVIDIEFKKLLSADKNLQDTYLYVWLNQRKNRGVHGEPLQRQPAQEPMVDRTRHHMSEDTPRTPGPASAYKTTSSSYQPHIPHSDDSPYQNEVKILSYSYGNAKSPYQSASSTGNKLGGIEISTNQLLPKNARTKLVTQTTTAYGGCESTPHRIYPINKQEEPLQIYPSQHNDFTYQNTRNREADPRGDSGYHKDPIIHQPARLVKIHRNSEDPNEQLYHKEQRIAPPIRYVSFNDNSRPHFEVIPSKKYVTVNASQNKEKARPSSRQVVINNPDNNTMTMAQPKKFCRIVQPNGEQVLWDLSNSRKPLGVSRPVPLVQIADNVPHQTIKIDPSKMQNNSITIVKSKPIMSHPRDQTPDSKP